VVAVLRPGLNAMLKEGYVRRNHKSQEGRIRGRRESEARTPVRTGTGGCGEMQRGHTSIGSISSGGGVNGGKGVGSGSAGKTNESRAGKEVCGGIEE
jgi:hypothetical protein